MVIKNDCEVTLNYRVKYFSHGKLHLYSKSNFTYTQGKGAFLESLESQLLGHSEGEKLQIKFLPNDLKDHGQSNLIYLIPFKFFKNRSHLYEGQKFFMRSGVGCEHLVQVIKMKKELVVLKEIGGQEEEWYVFEIDIVKVCKKESFLLKFLS